MATEIVSRIVQVHPVLEQSNLNEPSRVKEIIKHQSAMIERDEALSMLKRPIIQHTSQPLKPLRLNPTPAMRNAKYQRIKKMEKEIMYGRQVYDTEEENLIPEFRREYIHYMPEGSETYSVKVKKSKTMN